MNKKKASVLLIEDEKILANLIRLKLEESGYEATIANDGQEGLDLIRKLKPDLILLDLMLPTVSGFQILEALKEGGELPDLPIIIISNSGQPVEVERALNLGVRDYLIKVNFSPDEVLDKVNQVIEVEKARREKKF